MLVVSGQLFEYGYGIYGYTLTDVEYGYISVNAVEYAIPTGDGGCGSDLIYTPITQFTCNLDILTMDGNVVFETLGCDLQNLEIYATLTTTVYGAEIIAPILNGDLQCQ